MPRPRNRNLPDIDRPPTVYLSCLQLWEPLKDGALRDVFEGMQGEDRVVFTCWNCNQVHESPVRRG